VAGNDWGDAARQLAGQAFAEPVGLYGVCYVPTGDGSATLGVFTGKIDGTASPLEPRLVPVPVVDVVGVAEELAVDAATVIGLLALASQGLPEATRQDRVAFVAELVDNVRGVYAGTFGCEVSTNSSHERGPEGQDLRAALRWARQAAPRVTLEVGGKRFSAGELESHDGYPRWEGQSVPIRRPTGRAPLLDQDDLDALDAAE